MNIITILKKYTAGELTLEQANAELKGKLQVVPGKNELTEEEKRATTVGIYPDMANGWGLLDSGTGTLDKVKVTNGKIAHGMGKTFALCIIAGKSYEVKDDTLV